MKKFLLVAAISLLILTACSQENETEQLEESTNQTETQGSDSQDETEDSTSASLASHDFFEPFIGKMDHIHGLGYVGGQAAPFFAAHDGLKIYENGTWLKTKRENNDYMGFNATNDGFYSSGHPGTDSKLPNPIGIMKSVDHGQTLQSLGFEAEVDFHLMAVGYNNHQIFVMSPHKNSVMEADAFYVSEDEGANWKEVAASGLKGELIGLAVHPTDKNILAAAGEDGIYLSKDQGESFELLTTGTQGTIVYFTENSLLYGEYDGQPSFVIRNLTDDNEEGIALPKMKEDAVMYAAINPKNEHEITFVSFNNDIYQTTDHGESWNILAKSGNLQ
ncbi:F510_1955 family glycosylhydrolase [Robertmurraya beringensis]|uniref:F510_1955 family glycosylhydrolase n=1 Tax=Robertmurraya beringensis TaxID=641660 RepID=A0ABV6KTT5_9BACI